MPLSITDVGSIQGTHLRFIQTSRQRGYSNFCFANEFLTDVRLFPYSASLSRILSLARKHQFQGMLIDEIAFTESEVLQEENEALAKLNPSFESSKVYKLSFFTDDAESCISQQSFIGYVVFKIDYFKDKEPKGYVFESVLTPPRTHIQNHFLHCKRRYGVANSLGNFEVTGTLYAQQSEHSFVCAHVALRTILSCILPQGDIKYSQIARLAGSRKGLYSDAIERVLDGMSISYQKDVYLPADLKNSISPDRDFMKTMYGYTESGSPSLLGFEGHRQDIRHIVPIIGHTFNEDSWVPSSNKGYFGNDLSYYPSERWLSSHLMHDDNFGPYYCVPKHFITLEKFRLLLGVNQNCLALYSDRAEALALVFLIQAAKLPVQDNNTHRWFNLFRVYAGIQSIVLRPIFIAKKDYIKHLQTSLDTIQGNALESNIIEQVTQKLPDNFWMVEASCPELFSVTRRKFGEVVLATEQCGEAFDSRAFRLLRLPGLFITSDENNGKQIYETQIIEHTRVFSGIEE